MIKSNTIFGNPDLNAEIEKNAKHKIIEKGAVLIKPGDDIIFIPIVIKGSIRIIRQDMDGQEIFLYHLYPGQTCGMSLTCCQAGKKKHDKSDCGN